MKRQKAILNKIHEAARETIFGGDEKEFRKEFWKNFSNLLDSRDLEYLEKKPEAVREAIYEMFDVLPFRELAKEFLLARAKW